MTILLIALHVIVCMFLIFVVLLQSAQAADLAGAFGGGGSQTALGMRGATTLLQKATTAAAVLFMITSLALGIIGRRSESVIQGLGGDAPAVQAPATDEQAPAEPGTPSDDQESLPAAGEAGEPATDDQAATEQGTGEQGAGDQGTGEQSAGDQGSGDRR